MPSKLSERFKERFEETGYQCKRQMGVDIVEEVLTVVTAVEAWAFAMRGPTTVPPVVDRSIEDTEQALLKLIPED